MLDREGSEIAIAIVPVSGPGEHGSEEGGRQRLHQVVASHAAT